MTKSQTYSLTLRAEPNLTDEEATRYLRAALKQLLRCYGFRCTDAVQVACEVEPQRAIEVQHDD